MHRTGLPLAEPCSITDQRNFTVLAPDPRRLDADGDGIGCEPISTSGGTIVAGGSPNLYTSGGPFVAPPPQEPATLPSLTATSRPAMAFGTCLAGSRADNWFVHRDRNRAGLWFATPDRTSTGNLAVVSNPVFIGNGLWTWPNRFGQDDWFWQSRNHDGIWFRPNRISVGNLTIATSGSHGNVAVVSNPIFISNGVWHWPDRTHGDDWRWRNRPATPAGSGPTASVSVTSPSQVLATAISPSPATPFSSALGSGHGLATPVTTAGSGPAATVMMIGAARPLRQWRLGLAGSPRHR